MSDQDHHAEHSPHRLTEELHNHLAEIPKRLKEIPYNLEQRPPNKPSFLTVVILSGVAVIILFFVALFVIHFAHGRIEHPFRGHPTSQLVLPQEAPGTPLPASGTRVRTILAATRNPSC